MKNILLVENSPELLKTIKSAFKKYESQLKLLVAENGEEAVKTIEETTISALITDLYVPEVDFPELLACLSRRQADTPIIMTSFGSPVLTDILNDLNIHHALRNPYRTNELLKTVSEAINKTKQDESLQGFALKGYLRILQEEQKTCTLEVSNQESGRGLFYFIDGTLYDAECDGLQGEEAAITILGWQKISLNLKELESEDIPARIDTDLKTLLAKTGNSRKAAEPPPEKQSSQSNEEDPKKLIKRAIDQANAGHWSSAYKILAKLLKTNPKISLAWLWLSRTSENLKTIDVSLKNAATIAPESADIKGDIEKLKSAVNAGCGEADSLKHCPFCWAPVIPDKTSCHYCNAHINIHEDFFHSMFFSSNKAPDLEIIESSFKRFNKAKAKEPDNPHPCFFLAMAHINLNQWKEALLELEQTREIGPDNPYQRHLEILTDFNADLESFYIDDDEQPEK
ncbi:MAG: response regulator [Desulfurivibrionaceae bacterium]